MGPCVYIALATVCLHMRNKYLQVAYLLCVKSYNIWVSAAVISLLTKSSKCRFTEHSTYFVLMQWLNVALQHNVDVKPICTFLWINTLIVVQPIISEVVVAKVQDTRKLSAFCHTMTKLHTELSKQSFLAAWNIARSCLFQRSRVSLAFGCLVQAIFHTNV